jgi:hypothetical protein
LVEKGARLLAVVRCREIPYIRLAHLDRTRHLLEQRLDHTWESFPFADGRIVPRKNAGGPQ